MNATPDSLSMVVIRLREASGSDNLKYMSRFTFAALASFVATSAVAAQQVPGRDLLEFPIGLLAEAPPLSSQMPGGLWNPGRITPPTGTRGSIGVAALTTPTEQGVDLAMLGGEYRVRRNLTMSLSYAQASVRDIFRTTTDPQTTPGEIPYETSVISLGAATARGPVSIGVAARLRSARFDDERSSVGSFDVGGVYDRVAGTPLRIAASTFLLSPSRSREESAYSAAADLPLLSRDSVFNVRGGLSVSHTDGRGREDYLFATSAYRELEASAGIAQTAEFGHTTRRLRLGVGLRYAGYTVAFAREDGAGGIGASYQFLLKRFIR
jgi:hypothetical protein